MKRTTKIKRSYALPEVTLPEEIIVSEIISKLAIKPLFRFKSVARRYNLIISDEKWADSYLQQAYSSQRNRNRFGLTAALIYPFTKQNVEDKLVMQAKHIYKSIYLSYVSLPGNKTHKIVGASNGLILSLYLHPDADEEGQRFSLCVTNPLIKQSEEIPSNESIANYRRWSFSIVARSFAYKIVVIARPVSREVINHHKTISHIFSSDTGSWSTWEDLTCQANLFHSSHSCFTYKSIIHWRGYIRCNAIITYDPFNSPDRFGQIPLPVRKKVVDNNRICETMVQAGELGDLWFCQFERLSNESPCSHKFTLWQLVNYDKRKWHKIRRSVILDMPYLCRKLLVVPNPINLSVFCHPFLIDDHVMVFESQLGKSTTTRTTTTRTLVKIAKEIPQGFDGLDYCNRLISVEYCPWSSPSFYVAQR